MAPTIRAHTRSHNLLLLQKLLNLRDNASPLTLILDTLEQKASPLLREFIARAKIGRNKVIFVSFATIRRPKDIDVFVKARGKSLTALRAEIASFCPSPSAAAGKEASTQKVLIVIDDLNTLSTVQPRSISTFLSSIITPAVSVVSVYHTDVPVITAHALSEYEPQPLTLLCHLATAIFKVSNLYQAIERRKAQNRSQQEPEWGLDEGREGVLVGLATEEHGAHARGFVVEMEMRRRSGRAVVEKFVIAPKGLKQTAMAGMSGLADVILLSDHPLFKTPDVGHEPEGGTGGGDEDEMETTFNLGLTEKQRKDREGIVLPYFDAQTDLGAGEGGRILYEMGREDDFDDEEDEI